jgi:hypothetical protein
MTWKGAVSVLAAFALGASAVYVTMTWRRPAPAEEWGVVVAHFGGGPSLWGLFESKAECLEARPVYMAHYAHVTDAESPKPGKRMMLIDTGKGGSDLPVTFSCLPLSEIRGLSLTDGGRAPNSN